MAVYDPDKYQDENEGQVYVAPEGPYELYFSDLGIQTKYDDAGNEKKSLNGKVVFVDGPRKGKYFFHTFWIYNPDKDKRKKALEWLGNFFRAIGAGAIDLDDVEAVAGLLNRPFIGDVYIDEYQGKKSNKLRPWGFHKIEAHAPLSPPTFQPSSSPSSPAPAWKAPTTPTAPTGATVAGQVGPDGVRAHESDFPPF